MCFALRYQSTQILQEVPTQEAQQEVQSWKRQAPGGKAALRLFLVGWCGQEMCRGLSWPLDCEAHQGITEKVMGHITNNQGLKAGTCGTVLTS